MGSMLPSLDGFHDEIMTWNYYEIRSNVEHYRGQKVSLRYNSVADYASIMDPLLFEEVRATILRAREERGIDRRPDSKEHTRQMRIADAKFTKQAARILLTLELANDIPIKSREWVVQGDLVLISGEGPSSPDQRLHTLGIVDKVLSKDLVHEDSKLRWIVRVPGGGTNRGDGVYTSSEDGREKLGYAAVPGSSWSVTKLCSLVTAQREYQALQSVENLPSNLLHTMLKSDPAPDNRLPLHVPKDLEGEMRKEYNESQWRALEAALRGTITLIQGPPGTGKTKTILGLLSVLLNSSGSSHPENSASLRGRFEAISSRGLGVKSLGLKMPQSLLQEGTKSVAEDLRTADKTPVWRATSPWRRPGSTTAVKTKPLDLGARDGGVAVKRVLVCAPSNAAIDEIAIRMLESGLPGGSAERQLLLHPPAVRVGPNVHPRLESISLPYLVEKRLGEAGNGKREPQLGQVARDEARKSVLWEASVVFCTLSSAGTPLFSHIGINFDTVIIDEAAQAIELSTLIPVKYGCQRLIMVGDVAQLPATVLSRVSIDHGYDVSLFHRLQECGFPVWFLRTQYRMHPAISTYPAERFYMNKLVNAEELMCASRESLLEKHPYYSMRCFGPYLFYDMHGSHESESSTTRSWRNTDEAELSLVLYEQLRKQFPQVPPSTVGIITPYKGQVTEIQNRFKKSLERDEFKQLDINSIDGFQGREKDIVIFSCVRARKYHGVGFLADERRMNVALTRARFALWIIGSARTLRTNEHWRKVIENAQQRDCYLKVKKPIEESFKKFVVPGNREAGLKHSDDQTETDRVNSSRKRKDARSVRDSPRKSFRQQREGEDSEGAGAGGGHGQLDETNETANGAEVVAGSAATHDDLD
ncbi:hypothetical protein NDN08_008375 [Rhodosorus marinus]|uniref:AAA+ ATPase domain-containing protein n=1 Tax=Rhodosorus marinus TaxID=101924 RepID=A0AAV8V0B3_9RHOD|nr:hypothetical protein NDN08_008375 [Rhodosorus marinus]